MRWGKLSAVYTGINIIAASLSLCKCPGRVNARWGSLLHAAMLCFLKRNKFQSSNASHCYHILSPNGKIRIWFIENAQTSYFYKTSGFLLMSFCYNEKLFFPFFLEAPRLGIQLELQLLAYAEATAMPDPSSSYAAACSNARSLTHSSSQGLGRHSHGY